MILVQPFAVAILISAIFGVGVGAVSSARSKGHSVRAQYSWRIYSPPDKSFTVEVPVTPDQESESYKGEDESTPAGLKPLHSYVALVTLEETHAYFIAVFEVVAAPRGAGDKGIDELINVLTRASKRITRSGQISVARGRARELILANNVNDGNEFMRVRFIYLGERIYMLSYVTGTADDVYSRSANRFFNSFHVRP